MAKRIQRRRTKGWRMPEDAVYVGRPTLWGNPWVFDPARATSPPRNNARATRAECVRLFRDWAEFASPPGWLDRVRAELSGRDLACWCPLDQPCHADVLLELANHPCGHGTPEPGCGGCDPGAIEFVITDDGETRPFDPALDLTAPAACPYRAHYGGPCDCEARLAAAVTHTRTSTPVGPDYCQECSEAVSEWMPWPCPARRRAR